MNCADYDSRYAVGRPITPRHDAAVTENLLNCPEIAAVLQAPPCQQLEDTPDPHTAAGLTEANWL